jgi:hypothetical protein
MNEEYLTHEEILEIAEERESINAKKLEIDKQFDEWFEEMEGYSFRYERFWDDFDYAKDSKDNQSMVKWLRTAFEMGYHACESKLYGGTE